MKPGSPEQMERASPRAEVARLKMKRDILDASPRGTPSATPNLSVFSAVSRKSPASLPAGSSRSGLSP